MVVLRAKIRKNSKSEEQVSDSLNVATKSIVSIERRI